MAHDVFVSYASGDKPVADAVCAKLESSGIRCWIAPRDVLPGIHYGEAIIDAIHECRIMVLVFSAKANLSSHIPKEIERAVSSGVTVMPLRIEDIAPAKSLDYFIGSVHWLDALTPPLEVHLQKLAANVQTLLSRGVKDAEVVSRPAMASPITPPTAHTAPHPARPAWTNPVIGVLIAVILILGSLMFWSKSRGSVSNSQTVAQTATQTAANVPSAQSILPAAAMPMPRNDAPVSSPPATPAASAPIAPKKNIAPASPPAKSQTHLSYVIGSTVKLEQLIGDEDKERNQPTRNQTFTRYGLQGSDLGYSFEHQGRAYFLFGITVGRFPRSLGTIAMAEASDPEAGVALNFLTAGNRYLAVEPSDDVHKSRRNPIGAIEEPVSGISLGDRMYVAIMNSHPLDRTVDSTVLTRFSAPETFQPLRTVSQLPGGHFIKMSMHAEPSSITGLPPGGPYVLVWGTGEYRMSDASLSIVPVAEFESGKGTRYFAGLDATGAPTWSDNESDARPVVKKGTLGDLSVTWCKDLGLWLMTYDSREPTVGIELSYSRTPWGPWSEPQIVFNAMRDGALGKFIHNPFLKKDDGLAGPVRGAKNQGDPSTVRGGAYAPYVVERWTRVQGAELSIYYVLSTLNPYVVVLMKSRLKVD